jgi:hypothetical protein
VQRKSEEYPGVLNPSAVLVERAPKHAPELQNSMQSAPAMTSKTVAAFSVDAAPVGLLAVAIVAVAFVMIASFDLGLINTDTIQLISAARHLIAGDGLSTNIVYYDVQHQFEQLPTPMTVWPPGFPWLLAAALALGAPAAATAFAICLTSHIATSLLLYVGLRRLAISSWIASLAAIAWLVHPMALTMVIECYTEPFFVCTTLASCFALSEAMRSAPYSTRWLLVAGVCAALAILTRYSGVLWPAAAGMWLAIAALRTSSWRPFMAAIVFGSIPLLTTAALFARNFQLSGRMSGGQFEYGGAATLAEALHTFYWNSALLLGDVVTVNKFVLGVTIAALGVAFVATIRGERSADPTTANLLGLATAKLAVLGAFLLMSSIVSWIGFGDYRYWLPGIPFALLVLGFMAQQALANLDRTKSRAAFWSGAVALTASAAVVTSMMIEVARQWPLARAHPTVQIIHDGLAAQLPDGRLVSDALTKSAPILAHLEQRVAFVTDRSVVGLPDARFTPRAWTTEAAAHVVKAYGITQVLFFPPAFNRADEVNSNLEFFDALLAGHVPRWLRPIYVSDRVQLYAVLPLQLDATGEPTE